MHHCKQIFMPPSTSRLAPFTYLANDEHSMIVGPAISSGSPSLPNGTLLIWSARFAGIARSSLFRFVSIVPIAGRTSVPQPHPQDENKMLGYTGSQSKEEEAHYSPGRMELHRILNSPSAIAQLSIRLFTPAFVGV